MNNFTNTVQKEMVYAGEKICMTGMLMASKVHELLSTYISNDGINIDSVNVLKDVSTLARTVKVLYVNGLTALRQDTPDMVEFSASINLAIELTEMLDRKMQELDMNIENILGRHTEKQEEKFEKMGCDCEGCSGCDDESNDNSISDFIKSIFNGGPEGIKIESNASDDEIPEEVRQVMSMLAGALGDKPVQFVKVNLKDLKKK